MIEVHIKEPFWSAWKFYGWEKPTPGIGINEQIVDLAVRQMEDIHITINKDPKKYTISPKMILEIATKYNSRKPVGVNTIVIVIPISVLKDDKE